MRQDKRGGDVSLLLLSATGICVYQFGLHAVASENPCPHFGLHSLDICFLFHHQKLVTVGSVLSMFLKESAHSWPIMLS